AGCDLAEHRILAVKEAGIAIGDEELRIEGIRVLRTGSANDTALEALRAELRFHVRQFRTAHAGAAQVKIRSVFLAEFDVAGLRHKAFDDAVEHHFIIAAALGQGDDALDMLGRQLRQQLNIDRAALERQNQVRLAVLGKSRSGKTNEGGNGETAKEAAGESIHRGFRALRTIGGTKAEISPPIS